MTKHNLYLIDQSSAASGWLDPSPSDTSDLLAQVSILTGNKGVDSSRHRQGLAWRVGRFV